MNIRAVFARVMPGLSGQALAEGSTPAAAPDSDRRAMCASQPEKCAAAKKRFEEICAADPKACEAKTAEWREKMRERKAAPLPDTAPATR